MSHLFWLDLQHLKRIQHLFPKPRGMARSDDRKVLSGIIHVIRNGLRWRDAPAEYGPHKTLTIGLSGGPDLVSSLVSSGNWHNRHRTVKPS